MRDSMVSPNHRSSPALALGLAVFGMIASPAHAAAADSPAPANSFPGAEVAASPNSTYLAPVDDPFQKANRGLYGFDQKLDHAVVRPLAMTYRRLLPKTVRRGVRNGIDNLGEPNTLMNDLLQGRAKAGGETAARFVINSTVGVLGLFDVAGEHMNLPIHYSDFGQTLGRYGVLPGPYIYLPVLGPSNFRDGLGRVVDSFTGVLNIHNIPATPIDRYSITLVDGLDTRAEYDSQFRDLNRLATDPYVTVRSFYAQKRAALVEVGHKSVQDLPDFDAPSGPVQPPAPAAARTQPGQPG